MKNELYKNAVDHLEFSDDLYENVMKTAAPRPRHRVLRTLALAAVICALLVTTAFAVEEEWRSWFFGVEEMGTVEPDLSDAEVLKFAVSEDTAGVQLHYLDTDAENYIFHNGMLYNKAGVFCRVTEDYQLEAVEVKNLSAQLTKNGRVYSQDFDYTVTDAGIIAPKAVLYTLADGKILAMVWSEDHHCWPVYFDPGTNTIQDALPELSSDAFDGRICYAQPYRGGLLITTIAGENENGEEVSINGYDPCYNVLYYVSGDAAEPTILGKFHAQNEETFYVADDAIYYKSARNDCLHKLDEYGQFQPVTTDKTTDDLTRGLLTAWNDAGNLTVTDVVNGETYEIEGLEKTDVLLDETTGYNATRCSTDGTILITYFYNDYQARTRRMEKIGLLDKESGQVRLLECRADYGVRGYGWMDDNRFVVLYEDGLKTYLCIYEFTA